MNEDEDQLQDEYIIYQIRVDELYERQLEKISENMYPDEY